MKTTKADEKALLEAESRYCSYGDTVHYLEPAKLFAGCNGSFLYDYEAAGFPRFPAGQIKNLPQA